jgi:ribose transport system ATP-binding protein
MNEENVIFEARGISKNFPGVKALDNVDLKIVAGEVHCLAGENGAGKSTLIEILGGTHQMDSGQLLLFNKSIKIQSPKHAQELGIAVLHQEVPILRDLTVAENLFLGRQPKSKLGFVDYKTMYKEAKKWLDVIHADIDPKKVLGRLSVSKQQLVSIAKAISLKAQVIIFDEPSAVLTDSELRRLFEIISTFKTEGKGIVYISHRLEEIFEIGDKVTVLRNGKLVGSEPIKSINRDVLVQMLVGHDVSESYIENKSVDSSSNKTFEIRGINRGDQVKNINLTISSGEIFGIYGLVGSGRTEFARAIIGADKIESGQIFLDGNKLKISSPSDAIKYGICLVPEDRKNQGILLEKSISDNIALPSLKSLKRNFLISYRKISNYSNKYMQKLKISAPDSAQVVKFLSGGNQQKVVLAKWIGMNLNVFIFDEPTRGIDIGAKEEIRNLIRGLAREKKKVILISSEIPEILSIADRIGVMHEGRLAAIINRADATKEKLVAYSMGSTAQ